MARKVHLEGGLVVEMTNGEHRHITCCPLNGNVYHREAGVAFGEGKITNEDEFRRTIQRVVSRSTYDKR